MASSLLISEPFWRQTLERAVRQGAQTAVPIVAAVGATSGSVDLVAITIALAVSVAVSVLKALASLQTTTDHPQGWQLLDRAVPAAAGTALGFVPVDLADLVGVDWTRVAIASAAAAVLAVLALYATPPTPTKAVPAP